VRIFIYEYAPPPIHQGFDIAKDFNDQAVAENHSLKHGLAIMEHEELNFVSGWSRKMREQLRSIVIQVVLATDMSMCVSLNRRQQDKPPPNPATRPLMLSA
jgi:hypothetical protein